MKPDTTTFYAELPAFSRFRGIARLEHYRELPEDWHVVVADINGSTKAIEKGRYKDVNNIGASVIIAVINQLRPLSVPYVFGGDGASLCIPAQAIAAAKTALLATRDLASKQFGLDLRVGIIPCQVIRDSGRQVMVGKYQVNEHFQQAVFSGDGMAYADALVKSSQGREFAVHPDPQPAQADFSGFECRWKQIPSPHGETLSLLVCANASENEEAHQLYLKVLEAIYRFYGEISSWCPIRQEALRLSTDYRTLRNEIRIRTHHESITGKLSYAAKLPVINLIGRYFMAHDKVTGEDTESPTHWGNYKPTLIKNTDYRKFDDMLRMVISGTPEQRQNLTLYLDRQAKKGRLNYGVHTSPAAQITCMISDYNVNHVHFIDGCNGGYAMAARQLKSQQAQTTTAH